MISQQRTQPERRKLALSAALYVFAGVVAFAIASALVYARFSPASVSADPDGGIIARVKSYVASPDGYDLVFIGDSRTYCAIHADMLDPLVGLRSVNLSAFSHWFPTQYAEFRAIADRIPRNATVVWAIGSRNFSKGSDQEIQRVFPIAAADALNLVDFGFSPADLVQNVSWNVPFAALWAMRHDLRNGVFARLDRPVGAAPVSAVTISQTGDRIEAPASKARREEIASVLDRYSRAPGVVSADVLTSEGQITSVAQIRRGGSYLRTELNPEFFRAMQRANGSDGVPVVVEQKYWNVFIAILDLLHRRGLKVLVMPMEEAPYRYGSEPQRKTVRNFMDARVRPEVEKRGFGWISVDFDRLDDADYFDYNHLNSRGVAKFLPMLADAIKSKSAPRAGVTTNAVQ